jgi:hypothetical protein
MSAKTTGIIWELALSVPWRMVLLAMVDHADHDGAHMRASQAFIAWKTGYSVRNVARLVQELIADGLLVLTDESIGQENEYRIDLTRARMKPAFRGRKPKKLPDTHAKIAEVKHATHAKIAEGTHAKIAEVDEDDSSTHAKIADPHAKIAEGTHANLAIDSSKYHVGVGVGDSYETETRALFASYGIMAARTLAAQYAAMTQRVDLITLRVSIESLLNPSDARNIERIVRRLKDSPPAPGVPYERARAPTPPLEATRPNMPETIVSPSELLRHIRGRNGTS